MSTRCARFASRSRTTGSVTNTSPDASTVSSPPSTVRDSFGSSPMARSASALRSWFSTVPGVNSPVNPSRSAPAVPMLTTVRPSRLRVASASVVATAAAVFPIPVTTTGNPSGTYAASARVALMIRYAPTPRHYPAHSATGDPRSERSPGSNPYTITAARGCPKLWVVDSPRLSSGHGDNWLSWLSVCGAHLVRDAHGFFDKGLDDLGLGDGLDDLALGEDLALAVSGGDAEVGLAGLAGAVHDAAHDCDAERDLHALQAGGHLVGELVHVDLGATAGRAGDDLELALAQVQRLQDLQADLDLLDRWCGQRDADRVADALRQQRAEGDRRLDRALERRAGLGDAEVQRPVAALGKHLVGTHHHDRVVVLHRDLEVVEVVLLEQRRLPDRRLDQSLRGRLAILLQQPGVHRAGVHADPDRGAVVLRGLRDLLDLVVELADVARVHAYGGAAGLDRGEHVLRLEVDVGVHRDLRVPRDLRQRVRVVLGRAGHPDDVAAGRGELRDLLQGGVDVRRQRRRHRLHRDRRVAADQHLADLDLAGLAARCQHRRRQRGDTRVDAHAFP